MEYFFFVAKDNFQPLRPAMAEEREWFCALAQELEPYKRNIDRFDRVYENFCELEQILKTENNMAQLESKAKRAVADFLYSFNEFLDHWQTYLSRTYGEGSDYFRRYKELTSTAFDNFDEYKITYALRNFQRVEDVVDGVSAFWGEPAKLYARRDRILALGDFQPKYRRAIQRLGDRFELFPIFHVAIQQLEQIQKRLMFYSVTKEQERQAIEALRFKKKLHDGEGTLLLGTLLDADGNEIEPTDKTFLRLERDQARFSLSYPIDMPWGVCTLLEVFQGTDYKNF